MRVMFLSLLVIMSLIFFNCNSNLNTNESDETEIDSQSGPAVNPQWSAWIKNNSFPIKIITNDYSFEDLQFLKSLLQNRRLVQLGESSHGVRQFNLIKVRLIKFLHEEMGFNVIAFESGIFECYYGYQSIEYQSPEFLMKGSIFGVWYTYEVLDLFDYIIKTQSTGNPLILAGFDTQFSGTARVLRPAFLRDLIHPIDSDYAEKVFQEDNNLVNYSSLNGWENFKQYVKENIENLELFYLDVIEFIDKYRDSLAAKNGGDLISILLARQSVLSTIKYLKQLTVDWPESTLIRDEGMADNLAFLMDTVYPNQKIITWAHNFHICHANSEVIRSDVTGNFRSMGSWVYERYRPNLYTIGLYMYGGKAKHNNGEVYNIAEPLDNSLEAVCNEAIGENIFVDMLHQEKTEGNSWMFTQIPVKHWGLYDRWMVPRDQYDAILFIKTVNPPYRIPL